MSPDRVMLPAAGRVSPARVLVRVVLPAPLRPTRPIRSPGWTRKVTPVSRARAPARSSRSVTVIMGILGGRPWAGRLHQLVSAQCVMWARLGHSHRVEFDEGARPAASPVSDQRGGGGGLGIVGLILALVLGVNPADLVGGGGTDSTTQTASDLTERCRTGADANRDLDCRMVGIANSVQSYWSQAMDRYQEADTVLF